ncbi:zona pellucida-like domain-containing protein 1 isoform X2 [Esox lucius]|uniref:ZP domain-containing protein n=2 Tax=Esox lucius TaxID=8010 RepID=A0A3P8YGT4_ESOLU|nr:zona pellucida-like domain-containing protein 1 isoform X2 [Esox lucius]
MFSIGCLSVLVAVLIQPAFSAAYNCSDSYKRVPVNSDLKVFCGATTINLEVNLCTALWAGFDPAGLALNGEKNKSQCQGSIDTSVDPPIMRYQLPVNDSQENPCRQSLQIVDEVPDSSGPFSSFSSVQSVIITGYINTPGLSEGVVSYTTDLYYQFSCHYPLEYFLNNTKIVSSSVAVAMSGNNGTFINTLSMNVFNDSGYTYPLVVPPAGLGLRTKIYVEIKATNLTENLNLLLDHCFATPSLYNLTDNEVFNLFTGCTVDPRTSVLMNGISKISRFSFEAFRFVSHKNLDKSSIYLHCILRMCEASKCQEMLGGCPNKRRKRSPGPFGSESAESTTVSVGPLYSAREERRPDALPYGSGGLESGGGRVTYTGLLLGILFGTPCHLVLGIH